MKFFTSFLLVLFCSFPGFSQKDISGIYNAGDIKQLYIFTDEVFRINIKTTDTDQIIISSHSEGEYFNDISLDVEVFQKKMVLTSKFREVLQGGFDKLSAHKVFSLEITLEIPEKLEVFIKSNIASVFGNGNFEILRAELKNGSCVFSSFSGNAVINTYKGSIELETHNASITGVSRNGKVDIPEDMNGKYEIVLKTINGNILVREN